MRKSSPFVRLLEIAATVIIAVGPGSGIFGQTRPVHQDSTASAAAPAKSKDSAQAKTPTAMATPTPAPQAAPAAAKIPTDSTKTSAARSPAGSQNQTPPPKQISGPAALTALSLAPVCPEDSIKIRIPAGVIYGTFTKDDGPFLIEGSVIVPSGQTLEFGPGSRVYIGGKYSTITVFGQLIAKGTAQEPILFRSIKASANPWEWDRIYCRSRNRSTFEYCVVRDCNYGLYVENGMATVQNCLFEHNSLHGLAVANSSVLLRSTIFRGGHVLALLCQPGAEVTAESLSIVDNITGLACAEKSAFKLSGGSISRNTNGVAFMSGSAMALVGVDITRNVNGMLAGKDITKNLREMIYQNGVDLKIVSASQMNELIKPPEEVKSIVLPKTKAAVSLAEGFQPGFAALKAPQEPQTSFLGNVTVGFTDFSPTSKRMNDTLIPETKYLGEQSTHWYAGVQPETQIFMSGRRNGADINLLADLKGNEWNGLRKNMFNLSMNYAQQSVVIGDFFENGNETSISNRQMTGLRFSGQFLEMGRGEKQIEYRLAAGETEIPKDSGSHEIDLYNDKVDSSMSKRQQITYVAGVSVKPTLNTKVTIKGIISQDQTSQPLFRDPVTDPAVPNPVHGQTGCISGEMSLLGGALALDAELDVGRGDTLAPDAGVAWYNPQIPSSVVNVFDVVDRRHYAVLADAKYKLSGYDLALSYLDIGGQYFSAGNPYLEAARRKAELTGEKQFSENLSADIDYAFEQSSDTAKFDTATNAAGPLFRHTFTADCKYALGEYLPEFSVDYTADFQNQEAVGRHNDTTLTSDSTDSITSSNVGYAQNKLKNVVGIGGKQRFANGIEYGLQYRVLFDNDLTSYNSTDPTKNNQDNELQHQINAKFSFKLLKILRNKFAVRVTTKNKVLDDFKGYSYKITDEAQFTVIPRKLNLVLKGDFYDKHDSELDTNDVAVLTPTRLYGIEGEVKYTVTSKFSLSANGRYEVSRDATIGSTENYVAEIGGLHLTYLF